VKTIVSTLHGSKEEKYREAISQFQSLIAGENDEGIILGMIASLLKMQFETFSWVGFYVLKGNELVVGPFQGKPPCIRIEVGKGVCGTVAQEKKTLIVSDVDAFPEHIRCDADSRSEIVVPLFQNNTLYGVLDIDSFRLNNFDETDKVYLEEICRNITTLL